MKLLTILTAAVFCGAVIVFSTAYGCWVSAYAYASASVNAAGIKRGGYALTCTGRQPKALSFNGATSDRLSKYFKVRIQVTATASIGGGCPGGGGVQDFDTSTAGP